jgi:hypothetical protein
MTLHCTTMLALTPDWPRDRWYALLSRQCHSRNEDLRCLMRMCKCGLQCASQSLICHSFQADLSQPEDMINCLLFDGTVDVGQTIDICCIWLLLCKHAKIYLRVSGYQSVYMHSCILTRTYTYGCVYALLLFIIILIFIRTKMYKCTNKPKKKIILKVLN